MLYKHDCSQPGVCCQFIASTNSDDVYLYGCHTATEPQVLLRHSDEGSDYTTYQTSTLERIPLYIRLMIISKIQEMNQQKNKEHSDNDQPS